MPAVATSEKPSVAIVACLLRRAVSPARAVVALLAVATLPLVSWAANQPPHGVIDTPAGDVTIVAGESVLFQGSGTDPDGPFPLTFSWNFGGGASSRASEDPGKVMFPTAGVYNITLTAKDGLALADPSPATRVITVLAPPSPQADELHWTFIGQTAVSFDWRGGSDTLRYGLTPAYGQFVVASAPNPMPFSSPGPFREAKLTGLTENTVYHYSIGDGVDHVFHTPPPRGSSGFRVAVQGDIGSAKDFGRVAPVQSRLAALDPKFVLMVGDLTYGNSVDITSVDAHFNDMMVWSRDVAYMPAWGNHEYETPEVDDFRNYKGRFDLPNPQTTPNAPAPGCCGEDWSWFDYGNVRFISYPEPYPGAWADWGVKAAPIMEAAQADPAIKFIVTFGHQPAFSSGSHEGEPTLQNKIAPLAASYSKYVLNLNGHSHNYERSHPQSGVVHITAGTGGSGLTTVTDSCFWSVCPPPAWSAFRANRHVVVTLNFTATAIEGTVYCGPPDAVRNDISCVEGTVLDQFLIHSQSGDIPPAVNGPGNVVVAEGAPLTVNVTASDPDNDPITTLSADLSGLPAGSGAAFTAGAANATGTLTWTPSLNDAGIYHVTFTAANALPSTPKGLDIVVTNTNQPPVVSAPAAVQGVIWGTVTVNVTVSDPDGDPMGGFNANLSALPSGHSASWATGGGNTFGTLTWTPTAAMAGTYPVTFTASNGLDGQATTWITITTAGANFVGNPSFETNTSGWNGYNSATLARVPGGQTGDWACQATASGAPGAFGINDSPSWVGNVPAAGRRYRLQAWVRSESATGQARLRMTEYLGAVKVGNTLTSPPATLSPVWQQLQLDFISGASGSNLDFQVQNTPAAPGEVFLVDGISLRDISDTAPVVTVPTTVTVAEGAALSVSVTAADAEGDAITSLSADLTGLPAESGASFTAGAGNTSGTLAWTPSFAHAGVYHVTFAAANALQGAPADLQIVVNNTDAAPVVTAPATAHCVAGLQQVFEIVAADPDSEAIATLSADLSALPQGHGATFTAGAGNAIGTFTWAPTAAMQGTYPVTFTAANALAGSAVTTISVSGSNQPPVASLTLTPTTGNGPIDVVLDASGSYDPDGSIIEYQYDFGDGTSSGVMWNEQVTHTYLPGHWVASLLVTDDNGATARVAHTVMYLSVPPGPNLAGNPSFETNTGGWNGYGGATLVRVGDGFDGAWACESNGPAVTGAFGINDSPNWVVNSPAIGTRYRFSVVVRSANATGQVKLRVTEYVGTTKIGATTFSSPVTLSPTWQQLQMEFITQASGSSVDFQVSNTPAIVGEKFVVDNVSIRDVTGSTVGVDPPAVPLMARAWVTPIPVTSSGTLAFVNAREGPVTVEIFDLAGRRLGALLEQSFLPPGRHELTLGARGAIRFAPGVYLYRIRQVDTELRGRFVVVR